MDTRKQPEPYEPGPELDAALVSAEERVASAMSLDLSGDSGLWQAAHVRFREDLARMVTTVRDLLRERALLMEELRDAKARLAESKIKLVR
jgi:hypothetical protein